MIAHSLYEELLGRAEEKIARLKKIEEKTSKETTNCASAKLDLPSLIQAHNSSRAAWKDRKDMCQDALGTLSELMNKDTKRLAVSSAWTMITNTQYYSH
jgi:hypothetical protein